MNGSEGNSVHLKRGSGQTRSAAPSMAPKAGTLVRFGNFELRLDTGELERLGIRIPLQRRSFQVLEALLEQPGSVITREMLTARLWPDDTHVDFESGLNTAVNRLRVALCDSAESPIYVETLARIGYRFIAPVERVSAGPTAVQVSEVILQPDGGADPRNTIAPTLPVNSRPSKRAWVVWGGGLLVALAAALIFMTSTGSRRSATFRQITFSTGYAGSARFLNDGKTVAYSGKINQKRGTIYSLNLANLQTIDMGLGMSHIASAFGANLAFFSCAEDSGCSTLSVRPIAGGPIHVLDREAKAADLGPGGNTAVARERNGVSWLEYPLGHRIYTAHGWISDLRVSADGKRVAFAEHPSRNDDAGQIVIIGRQGNARVISSGWGSISGLAWHPSTDEVWFTAARFGVDRNLMAVDAGGHDRQVAQMPGGMILRDINLQGDVLIARPTSRVSMYRSNPVAKSTIDISWLDWSRATASSADAKLVLFDESGQGGGKSYSTYLYDVDKHTARRIGEGRAMDLSRDGRWALTQDAQDPTRVDLLSISDGKITRVKTYNLEYAWARFIPGTDCNEILFAGALPGTARQLYRQHLPDKAPQPIRVALQFQDAIIDAKSQTAVGLDEDMNFSILNLHEGTARSVVNPSGAWPVGFAGGHTLLVRRWSPEGRTLVERLNLDDWKALPHDRIDLPKGSGIAEIESMQVSDDQHTYVYSVFESVSTLFVVTGWT